MHDLPLLLNIAVALAYALIGGIVASRVGLPSIVGYLLAGVAIGPFSPGFVANQETIGQLAEMGVVFLMFGVGMHFSFRDLWRVRSIALPGATIQMAITTLLGYTLARYWGWTPQAGVILGLAVSVASTVVLLRALTDFGVLDSLHGRVAIGWLVFQDLATVAILVLLPLMGGGTTAEDSGADAVLAVAKAGIFVALMLTVGTRVVPWVLGRVVRLKSRELFVLVALTIALGTALASAAWFGVSLALGAFIAGVVVSDSPYGHQLNAELLPFRDTFTVLFFVSVGMLVNPMELLQRWPEVLALSGLVIIGNSLIGSTLSFLLPYPARTGLIVGAGLGQIGEFSFIVGQTGLALGILAPSQYSLILAGAIVSITVNPFLFKLVDPIERLLRRHSGLWSLVNREGARVPAPHQESLRDHVVIVGSGRVGHHLSEILGTLGVPRLVIDSDSARVDALTKAQVPTLYGDAANSTILEHAALPHARALVVTVPNEAAAIIIVAAAEDIAPGIVTIVRAGTDAGARRLAELGAESLVRPEFEGGLQIVRATLLALGFPPRRIQTFVDDIRGREAVGRAPDDEMTLVRRLAASDLELGWLAVHPDSALAGKTIAEANVRVHAGATIIATDHDGVLAGNPGPDFVLQPGDRVAIIGRPDQLATASALLESPTSPNLAQTTPS